MKNRIYMLDMQNKFARLIIKDKNMLYNVSKEEIFYMEDNHLLELLSNRVPEGVNDSILEHKEIIIPLLEKLLIKLSQQDLRFGQILTSIDIFEPTSNEDILKIMYKEIK